MVAEVAMSERVYVLAGTVREYEDYTRRKQGGAYRYISGPLTLRGTRAVKYVRVGTWVDRPDLVYIEDELEINGAEEVQP